MSIKNIPNPELDYDAIKAVMQDEDDVLTVGSKMLDVAFELQTEVDITVEVEPTYNEREWSFGSFYSNGTNT